MKVTLLVSGLVLGPSILVLVLKVLVSVVVLRPSVLVLKVLVSVVVLRPSVLVLKVTVSVLVLTVLVPSLLATQVNSA